MNLVTRMLGHLSGAMTNVFLLLMTVVFMLFEVQLLPYKRSRRWISRMKASPRCGGRWTA